ncbi:ABC transporter ATP-binding protein/permease [Candidatus Acetothermia bacterium]|jgi:ATP-binding cassette subfamily B protein/subfamily B ATP-binding cassette protein MsbA|nr:ABC transporter ATP-binding protein/permease [Candidatus Acetothermia bacterium]MCI2431943.1 ABC transporter ATP-binding protein/permease [Candidatus Acetothermia bacterium]MCI2436624.1 ABC transporter ATP-binding protein/permease [Candidatus Acetothermia bacterium]
MNYHWEEEKLGAAYDSALMRRLLTYVRPYRKLFALCLVLILFITAFELAMPYITKIAIDRFILLPHGIVRLPDADPLAQNVLDRHRPLYLEGDQYLIDVTALDQITRTELETKRWLDRERYALVEERDPKLYEIVQRNLALFKQRGAAWLISQTNLRKLSLTDLLALRAPQIEGLHLLAILFVAILLLRLLVSFAQVYILQLSGQRIMKDMRMQIFEHLMRLPTKFFDKNPVGRLVTRASNDVSAINEMYASVLVYLFKDIFLVIGIFGIMLQLNWRLGLLMLVLAPLIAYATWEFRKRARDAYRDFRRKLAKLNAYLQESLSGMRIIQIFAQERRSYETFHSINQEEYEANMRQLMIFAVFQPIIHLMSALAVGLVIWYGGWGVIDGGLTLGALVAFLSYVEMLFAPIRDLAEKYNILQGAMASAERIFLLLDEKPEDRGRGRALSDFRGAVEFRNVWFAYQNEDWVLRGLSFRIEPGERVAIVGPTGSGKTTIIGLLARLYDIQKGQILLDGTDIRELDLQFLRSQMAVVLQDVFLFSGDILGNIRLQSDGISRERAIEAAKFVQADRFIERLSNGYDAEVQERGATLSVGQRQLLAFARAVAFDPKILILDEATANIDSQTESLIQESLEKILRGRTSVTIAHRLSTIRESDKILVLHKGQLIEQGTHQELLERKGLYHALYTLQFAEEEATQMKS